MTETTLLKGVVMAAAKLQDGTEVEIRFDKFHYRAYDSKDRQIGPERVVLASLLMEIKGELVMEQGSGENAAGGRDKSVLENGEDKPGPVGPVDAPFPEPEQPPGAMPGPDATPEQPAPHAGPEGTPGNPEDQKDQEMGDPRGE